MEPKRLLYICDLNLKHGGAQKNTYKTIGCLSKAFEVVAYITEEPSPESLDLLDELQIEFLLDTELDIERLRNVISSKKISLVLIQYENPDWILAMYRIKKVLNVRYTLFLHEIPIIGTPTNKFIKCWFILASVVYLRYVIQIIFNIKDSKSISELLTHRNKVSSNGDVGIKNVLFSAISAPLRFLSRILDILWGLKDAEKVIAMGPASKFYIDHFLKLKNVIVIEHNAASDISPDVALERMDFDYDICFMAARLEPRKGVFDVLEVVREVKKLTNYEVKAVILGRFVDDGTRDIFFRKVRRLGLESNIYLLGFVSEREKVEILKSSKVFLYPSTKDVFSISLADALSLGLPAVVFNVPFVKQFRNTGIYESRLGDTKNMARKIAEILALCREEPTEYAKLRKNVRENFLLNFNWEITCKEQISAIGSIISNFHN